MYMFGDYIPGFICQYLKFFSDIHTNYSDGNKNVRVRCNKFITAAFIVGNLVNLENLLLLFKKPERPQFLTSLLIQPGYTIVHRIPLMILQIWVWLHLWARDHSTK
ncbi:unnamed protein product [Orchesella dallaii]|uniref:Uncharacterized protein n=1 Tax=Orchesella dallaii TaxID=48710 RepID=A0ABP1PT92_9HEXA